MPSPSQSATRLRNRYGYTCAHCCLFAPRVGELYPQANRSRVGAVERRTTNRACRYQSVTFGLSHPGGFLYLVAGEGRKTALSASAREGVDGIPHERREGVTRVTFARGHTGLKKRTSIGTPRREGRNIADDHRLAKSAIFRTIDVPRRAKGDVWWRPQCVGAAWCPFGFKRSPPHAIRPLHLAAGLDLSVRSVRRVGASWSRLPPCGPNRKVLARWTGA